MPTLNHLHTYKRVVLPRTKGTFQCADPLCTFRSTKPFLFGKMARCPHCGTDYILTGTMLKFALPHCQKCIVKRGTINHVDLATGTRLDIKKPQTIVRDGVIVLDKILTERGI